MLQLLKTVNLLKLFGMAKITKEQKVEVREFLYSLDLIPDILITPEVVKLIQKSWERQFQREDLERIKKEDAKQFLLRLRERGKKRSPQPVLNNMLPLNFDPEID